MNKNEYIANILYQSQKIDQKTFEQIEEKMKDKNFDCLDFLIEKKLITQKDKIDVLGKIWKAGPEVPCSLS